MGNSFQVEVSESREELQHRLRHAITGTTKERLQMLYWLKVGAIAKNLRESPTKSRVRCSVLAQTSKGAGAIPIRNFQ